MTRDTSRDTAQDMAQDTNVARKGLPGPRGPWTALSSRTTLRHMATFTLALVIDAPGITRFRTRTIEIPPDYDPPSRRELFVNGLERIATDLIEGEGWIPRIREAALANDAKITRIEELIEGEDVPDSVRDAITEVILTAPADAIEQWGSPPIEDD